MRFAEGAGKMSAITLGVVGGAVFGAAGCGHGEASTSQQDMAVGPDMNAPKADLSIGPDMTTNACQPKCASNNSIEICVGPDQKKKTITCEDGWTCSESSKKAGEVVSKEASCSRPSLPSNDLCPPGDEVHCVLTDEIDVCEEPGRSTAGGSCGEACGSDSAASLWDFADSGVAVTFFAGLPEVSVRYRVDARIELLDYKISGYEGDDSCDKRPRKTLTVDWGDGAKRIDLDATDWPQCTYQNTGYYGAGAIIDGKVRTTFFGRHCLYWNGYFPSGNHLLALARTRLLKCWCRDTPLPPG